MRNPYLQPPNCKPYLSYDHTTAAMHKIECISPIEYTPTCNPLIVRPTCHP